MQTVLWTRRLREDLCLLMLVVIGMASSPAPAEDASALPPLSPELQKEISKHNSELVAFHQFQSCSIGYAKRHLTARLTATELTDTAMGSCMIYAEILRRASNESTKKELSESPYPRPTSKISEAAQKSANDQFNLALRLTRDSVMQAIAQATTN
jgi:hypothetical protein